MSIEYTEQSIRNAVEVDGLSINQVSKILGKDSGQVVRFCKRHNIVSKHHNKVLNLPLDVIKIEYENGATLTSIAKKYNTNNQSIKSNLLKVYPNIIFRSKDEIERPSVLNDSKKLRELMCNLSLTKIAKLLNVRTATVCNAVKRLSLSDDIHRQDIKISKDDLYDLYINQNLSTTDIADMYNTYPSTICCHLDKHNIKLRAAGGVDRPSKYVELNNYDWVYKNYIVDQKSLMEIGAALGCSAGVIAYAVRRHKIAIRPKSETYSRLRRKESKHDLIKTRFGDFTVHSDQESRFLREMDKSDAKNLTREPCTFTYLVNEYTPDFKVDDDYIEIKPPEYSKTAGINRQKFVKQYMVAFHNNINIKVWYKGKFFDIDPISNIDIYFAQNWKLFFNDKESLLKFIINFGFKPLKSTKDDLLLALNYVVPEDQMLNANFANSNVVDFIKNFNDHFWYSSHKGYNYVAAAFEPGNSIILKNAIDLVWDKPSPNIKSLVAIIVKHFKDFINVSIFKPWVAKYVYKKFLPNGGIVIDPCMGWGGRLFGTLDLDIQYIGFDFNRNSVKSNQAIADFIGNRIPRKPLISHGDSSIVDFGGGDLLFTSPPYDDTECYNGLEKQCSNTEGIYNNIFKANVKIIALNIPLRHSELVISIGIANGWRHIETLEMKTANFIARTKTHEPILVFKR